MSDISIKLTLDELTGDFWIDNGLVVLYDLFGEGEFKVSEILDELVRRLTERGGNKGFYYDLKEGKIKEYPMENWKYPTNYFIKATPNSNKFLILNCGDEYCEGKIKATNDKIRIKISKEDLKKSKRENGKKSFIFLEPPKRNLRLKFSKSKQICGICGNYDYVVDGKQWIYPFLVDPQKFSNFYSMTKGKNQFCPRCAVAGLAGYLGWIYSIRGKDYMHIFVFHSDMETLYELRKEILAPLSLSASRSHNFPMVFSGEYIHETTMGLILSFFQKIKSREDIDADVAELFDEVLSQGEEELRLFAISGKPGQGFNMSSLSEFSKFTALYRLYDLWLEELRKRYEEETSSMDIVNKVFKQFYIIQNNRRRETIWRDKICWTILEFNDPFPYIESYLFDGIGSQKVEMQWGLKKGTLLIFEKYAEEVLKMDEEKMKMLAAFGHDIGRECAKKENMGS